MTQIKPRCVLDFYVHESLQRQGVGQTIFEFMLEFERMAPEQFAYDRPSPKLLGFLAKNYKLANYSPQVNNFVIFNEYFTKRSPKKQDRAANNQRMGQIEETKSVQRFQ